MNPTMILMVGGGLGLLMLLVGVGITFISGRSVVEERLGRYSETGGLLGSTGKEAGEKKDRTQPLSDFLNRMIEGTDYFDTISRNLARADIKFRPAEFITIMVISAVGMFIVGLILGGGMIAFGLLTGIFGLFIPNMYVKMAQGQRIKKFDGQLGDMLNLMVNGLRAGYSTLQAMEAISKELPTPISTEFRRVVQEMQLGIPMEEALNHLLRRNDSADLDLVITAINVQREVGGNLAEILDTISHTIRERVRIKGEIQALTAQGQATAWVIAALPIVLVLLLFVVNREYIMQFFLPETRACGIPLLILAGLMIISGFLITQKIVKIDI
ncbi:MAG: type II secretion system F family protein [Anaerolineales bacterium]|nr:type II secretion system F family protein [Anaerolineales bacterium]